MHTYVHRVTTWLEVKEVERVRVVSWVHRQVLF